MATGTVASAPARGCTGSLPVPLSMPSLIAWTIGFGLCARIYGYVRNPGVWMDELFLLRNIVGKSYVELLGPLIDEQAAPPLFLWLQRTAFLLGGDSPLVLRFVPLLASCVVLGLLVWASRGLISKAAVPWAIFLFACSDCVIGHTVEAKQYLFDCLIAVLLPTAFVVTREWTTPRRFLTFALLAPVAVFGSYAGCFGMGAVLVALLPELWDKRREASAWITYSLIAVVTFGAFAVLVVGPIRAQHSPELHAMWTDSFPDWTRPWTVPLWTLNALMHGFDHAFRPIGVVFLPAGFLGAIALWRRGRKAEMLLLALPVGLALFAAWLHAFPFHSRVILFTTVPLAMLTGEGVAWLLDLAERRSWKVGRAVLVALFLMPVFITAWHIVEPLPRVVYPWPEMPAHAER